MFEIKTLPADFSPTTAVRFPPTNRNLKHIPSEGIVVPHCKGQCEEHWKYTYFPFPKSATAWDAVIADERTYWHEQMEEVASSCLPVEFKFKTLVHLADLMEKRLGKYHELKGAGLTSDKLTKLVLEARKFSRMAAAKTKKQLDAKSRGGKAGHKNGGLPTPDEGTRKLKETMKQEVRALMKGRVGSNQLSKNGICQIVARKHIGEDGKPIFKPNTIKCWFMPSRRKRQRKATS